MSRALREENRFCKSHREMQTRWPVTSLTEQRCCERRLATNLLLVCGTRTRHTPESRAASTPSIYCWRHYGAAERAGVRPQQPVKGKFATEALVRDRSRSALLSPSPSSDCLRGQGFPHHSAGDPFVDSCVVTRCGSQGIAVQTTFFWRRKERLCWSICWRTSEIPGWSESILPRLLATLFVAQV